MFVAIDARLNSYQYSQLCDRLMSPIRTARGVVIHQSLSDRFVAAFAEQVERNGIYTTPTGAPVRFSDTLVTNDDSVFHYADAGALCWMSAETS